MLLWVTVDPSLPWVGSQRGGIDVDAVGNTAVRGC